MTPTITPEFALDELRKLKWSKDQWLDHHGGKFPETLVETRRRERDVLAYAVSKFEIWVAKRAEDGKAVDVREEGK